MSGDQTNETLGNIPPSLQSLFDRDPLSLIRPEINSIVDELRKQRVNFASAESEARVAGKRVNAKKAISGEKTKSGLTPLSVDIAKLMEDL